MSNILSIDTSSNEKIAVALKNEGQIIREIVSPITKQKAQIVLPLIDELLSKCHTNLNELTGIEVNSGPGSFTGLRVGVAVANTLAFTLKIPVNHKNIGEYEEPKYE